MPNVRYSLLISRGTQSGSFDNSCSLGWLRPGAFRLKTSAGSLMLIRRCLKEGAEHVLLTVNVRQADKSNSWSGQDTSFVSVETSAGLEDRLSILFLVKRFVAMKVMTPTTNTKTTTTTTDPAIMFMIRVCLSLGSERGSRETLMLNKQTNKTLHSVVNKETCTSF